MADVFISYSKASQALTKSLAEELEAKGYSVWWDTGLLPGESFSDVIIAELDKARAAIVIWTPDSVKSQWVRSEATRASRRGVLIPVRDEHLDPNDIPPPFDNLHTDLITNRAAIVAALSRLGVVPPAAAPRSPQPPPRSDADIAEMMAIEHWQAIKATTDAARLREFLAEFGTSKIARLARDKIVSLEEAAWRQLPKRRTVAVLNAFLKEFPDGRYAAAAATAIAQLEAAQAPKPAAKPVQKPANPRVQDAPQAAASDASSTRWLQVVFGMGCMAVIANVQFSWTLFTGPMMTDHGWAVASVGFAFSIYAFAQTWLIPLPGYLVDWLGPKWVVCGGAVLVALAGILNALADSLPVLYLGAAVGGIGTGAVYVAAIGSTLKWFEERRGLAVGLVTCGFGIIAPLSILPVASTIELLGYRRTLLLWGIVHGIALALLALFMRAPRLNELSASASAHESDRGSQPTEMLQAPAFWVLYGILVVIAVASPIMRNQFSAITTALHVTRGSLVWIYAISSIALGLSQPLFGWMSDRFGRENSMSAAFALAAVAIAALWVLPQNEATVSLVYCVASFAAGAAAVLFPVACADRFGNRFAGTNYGLLHTAKGFGLLLSNLLLAVSALALTDWTVIAAVAVLNLIGAIVALVVLKPLANRHPSGLVGR